MIKIFTANQMPSQREKQSVSIHLFGAEVDVTEWQDKHPGGRKLLKIFQNRDATQQFLAIHKGEAASKMLKSMAQKPLSAARPTDDSRARFRAAEAEFNEVVESMKPELCKINPIYEILKLSYVVSFSMLGYAMCFRGHKYIGLSMICASLYQAGWVGHDYSHRSILASPSLNNKVSDYLGWLQGYTDGWWKARHNTHHMVTNEVGNDPDVRTEPVLHFHDAHVGRSRRHVPLQHIWFTFLLGVLDVFWRYESLMIIIKNWKSQKGVAARLSLHYALLAGLLMWTDVTPLNLLCLMYVRGFMTAIVVFANHYPEDRLPPDHEMGLFEQTLRTSRNTSGLFTHSEEGICRSVFNECTGYLSMQIEHHLAPTWPSGNLMRLRPVIRALAAKHSLPYKESSLLHALWDNISKLSDVSLDQIRHIK